MATDPYISVTGGMPVTFSGSMDINMNGFPVSCQADLILSDQNDVLDMLHASGIPHHTDMRRVNRDMIFSGESPSICIDSILLTAVTSMNYISTNASPGKLGDVTLYSKDFTSSFNGSGCIGDLVGHLGRKCSNINV